tara:strand:- start:686 stop:1384 length:699 start_codon:yes stop_codon:yes gene_type:complete
MSNVWETLSKIDCSKHVEKKNGFTYLSWAWAWTILKQHYPTAQVTKHLFQVNGNQLPYMLDTDGHAYVTVTVKIMPEGNASAVTPLESATEIMPVLNHANRPIKNPNSFEVNASLQRCMVKAIALLGLGCYIYAGEDLPATSDAGGGDSSPRKPAKGRTSPSNFSETSGVTPSSGGGVQQPKKIASPLTMEQEIAIAPDLDSLKKLYTRLGPAAKDHNHLFTKRKKELEANG